MNDAVAGADVVSSFSSVLPPVTMKSSCTATSRFGPLEIAGEQIAVGDELAAHRGEEELFVCALLISPASFRARLGIAELLVAAMIAALVDEFLRGSEIKIMAKPTTRVIFPTLTSYGP